MNNLKIIKLMSVLFLTILSFSIGLGINLRTVPNNTKNVEAASQTDSGLNADSLSTLIVLNSLFNTNTKSDNNDLLRLIAVNNLTKNGHDGLGELIMLNGLFSGDSTDSDLSKLIVLYRMKY